MIRPVKVTTILSDGNTYERVYEPGAECPMSQQEYAEFAVGNLLALVLSGHTDTLDLTDEWAIITLASREFVTVDYLTVELSS